MTPPGAARTWVLTLHGDPSGDVAVLATGRSRAFLTAESVRYANGDHLGVTAYLVLDPGGSWRFEDEHVTLEPHRTRPVTFFDPVTPLPLPAEEWSRLARAILAALPRELAAEGLVAERRELARAAHTARRRLAGAERTLATRRREAEEADAALASLLVELDGS